MEADRIAHKPPFDFTALDKLKIAYYEICNNNEPISIKDLVVNGNDMIVLGITKGKDIGETLKYLLGKHLDVNPKSVHAYIIGEHGDSELAVWSSANVSGIPITDFCELRGHKTNHNENEQALYEEVKNSAYEIIKKKGATYYGIALSVRRICESIVHDEHSSSCKFLSRRKNKL